ncbi:zinc finger protein 488-like [Lineus longissimus]|uniref:zinc finger protein 488-like n=1 Tax=Lineus longissimus TaxID=88925 RepID=UPI002B4F3543
MGLLSTSEIPYGSKLGPIPPAMTLTDPAYLIGHMTQDKYPDVPITKIDKDTLYDPSRIMEWLPYIHPARNEKEQNVEVYSKDGQIYYRTIRTILPKEEILAWYSRDFALMLGIPEVQPSYRRENGCLCCPMCESRFRHPYSLRSHMRFKCEYRRKIPSAHQVNVSKSNHISLGHSYDYIKNNIHSPVALIGSKPRLSTFETGIGLSLDKSKNSIMSKHEQLLRSPLNVSALVPQKRKYDGGDGGTSPKHRLVEDQAIDLHLERVNSDAKDYKNHKAVTSTFNHVEEEGGSAFRKVEKSHSPKSSPTSLTSPPIPRSSNGVMFPATSSTSPTYSARLTMMSSGPSITKDAPSIFAASAPYLPRFPMMPANGFHRAMLPPGVNYNENLPINFSDMQNTPLKAADFPRPHDKLSDIRNLETGAMQTKLPYYVDGRVPMGLAMPVKVTNPMVEKLLTAPAPALLPPTTMVSIAQNWCAKCNATFRMTSDLVYHMRSHHHREFDPIKRKREEKLKCTICNETFRERHHLTRHMTSHL